MDDSTAAASTAGVPFATECDLVMKGGITSGIIYPLAIVEIARAFRLRSIGGTSAGAIAAAAAAAAELGRQRHRSGEVPIDPAGFDALAALPTFLSGPSASGGTRLLALFQPLPALRPVFDALVRALAARGWGARLRTAAHRLAWRFKGTAFIGLLAGALPLAWLPREAASLPAALWLAAFAVLLAYACGIGGAVRRVLQALPAHGFGFCSGMPAMGDPSPEEALTPWLTAYLDQLAGQAGLRPGQPLTFGDLRAHGIELQVMTTCLTLGRPFRLPFGDEPHVRENRIFWFDEAEFRSLFPAHVVDWMKARERPYKPAGTGGARLGQVDFSGLLSLPPPDELPVIVAVRMSLSFPLLLGAVPLYSIDFNRPARPGERPERCWFTDGGVGSNFPIHFFDAPLPTRPTFGLDLGLAERADVPRVVFPETNGDARLAYWRRFEQGHGFAAVAGFLASVVSVAKDWNHEALSHLPGFRDRIGLVRLTAQEGGLNLGMPAPLIRQLTDYGRQAGQQFVRRFGNPALWATGMRPSAMNWENHQAIRLRLILASTAEMLARLQQAVGELAGTPADYGRFFRAGYGPTSYRFTGLGKLDSDPASGLPTTQAGLAHGLLAGLLALADQVERTVAAAPPRSRLHPGDGAPRPLPELKLRPRV